LENEKRMKFHSPHALIVTQKYVESFGIKSSGEWVKILFCSLTPCATKRAARSLKSQEEISLKCLDALLSLSKRRDKTSPQSTHILCISHSNAHCHKAMEPMLEFRYNTI